MLGNKSEIIKTCVYIQSPWTGYSEVVFSRHSAQTEVSWYVIADGGLIVEEDKRVFQKELDTLIDAFIEMPSFIEDYKMESTWCWEMFNEKDERIAGVELGSWSIDSWKELLETIEGFCEDNCITRCLRTVLDIV